MKLRTRVALTVGALAIPSAFGMALVQRHVAQEALFLSTAQAVVARLEGVRERCEADPVRFARRAARGRVFPQEPRERIRRPGRGMGHPMDPGMGHAAGLEHSAHRRERAPRGGRHGGGVFLYDADFRSALTRAPRVSPSLVAEVRAGEPYAARPLSWGRGLYELLVPMPWEDGPCAAVLLRVPTPFQSASVLVGVMVALIAALVAALAIGPVVRRLRLLDDAVRSDAPIPLEQGRALSGGVDEVGRLAHTLHAQREEIAARVRALQERDAAMLRYVANTTHDVMVPLTVLQGHLVAVSDRLDAQHESVATDVMDVADAKVGGTEAHSTAYPGVRARVTAALEESHYLASLLRNLNAAARLDAGLADVLRDRVDLSQVVESVALRHAPIAEAGGIELVFATPEPGRAVVLGDVTLIERAVSNLVHNAVRYNREGGHVAITLTVRGERFTLRVMDDGPGVSDAALSRMGERGFRATEARTRRPGGMGLGLHIASDVAARHKMRLAFAHARTFDRSVTSGLAVTLCGALV